MFATDILREHAVAVPAHQPIRLNSYWATMLTLDQGGPFSVAQIAQSIALGQNAVGHLTDYVAKLARGGFIAEAGRKGRTRFYRIAQRAPAAPQVQFDGSTYPYEGKLSIVIPRSEAGVWAVIRELTKGRKEFTVEAISDRMLGSLPLDEIADYVGRLTRGRFVEMAGVTLLDGKPVKAWRLIKRQPETPRLARDGTPLLAPQRTANLWRSMKMLGYFTALQLAAAASLPELPITEEQAERYAADLAAAGYLIVRKRDGEAQLYRLKSTMNTGPAAPEILRARFVWDPNQCRIVGEATAVSDVRT